MQLPLDSDRDVLIPGMAQERRKAKGKPGLLRSLGAVAGIATIGLGTWWIGIRGAEELTSPSRLPTAEDPVQVSTSPPYEPTCGNGVPDPGEICDDGNDLNYDACSTECETNVVYFPASDTWMMGLSVEQAETLGVPLEKSSVGQVPIRLWPFQIMKNEVTQGSYGLFLSETHRPPPTGKFWEPGQSDWVNRPAIHVTIEDAMAYCSWLNEGELPSEAQWEYAARSGGQVDKFWPWGDEQGDCEYAVLGPECGKQTLPHVCSRPKGNTEQGLCDMAGGVYEFVRPIWSWNELDTEEQEGLREEYEEDMKKSRKPVSDSSRHPKHPLTSLMPREGLPFENPVEDSYDTGVIVRGGGYWDGVPWRAGMTRERLFLGHDQQDDKTMKSRQQIGLGFRCAWTMPTRTPYGDSLPIDIDP